MDVKGEWQVQTAKNRLSELLTRAQTEGPQRITRHGERVAVVLSEADFAKLNRPHAESDAFVSFLLTSPFAGLELPERRRDDEPRDEAAL